MVGGENSRASGGLLACALYWVLSGLFMRFNGIIVADFNRIAKEVFMDYAAFLRQHAPAQQEALASYRLPDGTRVWLRRAAGRNPLWLYRVLGAVVAVLRLPVLRPVPNLGGTAALAIEVRRLRELAAAGVCVPDVLAQEESAVLLGDVGGITVQAALEQADSAAALRIWAAGLAAIAQVHQVGQYLSQAFARNMLWRDDATVAFIDFEDDPAAVLPLAHCQCRDWLCYLHSTTLVLEEKGVLDEARHLWMQQWVVLPVAMRDDLQRTWRSVGGLCHLRRRSLWGKDALKIAAMLRLLRACAAT